MNIRYIFLSSTALALFAQPAFAQDAETDSTGQADTQSKRSEIIVTARKREETLTEAPLSIIALSGEDLADNNISSFSDLSNYAPGVNVNGNYSGRNDRSQQAIVIRGVSPSNPLAQTASLFIDGVPVGSATALNSVGDPARVEIIKGPQSAVFGRATFSGAINIVTKTPSDYLSGSVEGMIGTRDNYSLRASVEGPLIEDILSFRVTGGRVSKSGSYKNSFNPNETLGDQQTDNIAAQLVFTPTSNLRASVFGMFTRDNDGQSATGMLGARQVTDAADGLDVTGNIIVEDQSNCTLNGRANGADPTSAVVPYRFICGVTPGLGLNQPGNNTDEDAFIDALAGTSVNRVVKPSDGAQGFGLVREYRHLHFGLEYDIGDTGLTVSSLTGYNEEFYSQMSDTSLYGNTDVPNLNVAADVAAGNNIFPNRAYYSSPVIVERDNNDFSQEFRLAYDKGGALTASVGVNYLYNYSINTVVAARRGTAASIAASNPAGNASKTYAGFFALNYEMASGLSLSLEGRYQADKIISYAARNGGTTVTSDVAGIPLGLYPANSVLLQKTYKSFLPRAIIKYEPNSDLMVYASYSEGINPAQFNNFFLNIGPVGNQVAQDLGFQVEVVPERIDNYEVGVKGWALNGNLNYALSFYYAKWSDQVNTTFTTGFFDGRFNFIFGGVNAGSTDLMGAELDLMFTPTENLDISFSGAITDTDIDSYVNFSITQLTGVFDFSGNESPSVSKYSANLGVRYTDDFAAGSDSKWFVRADGIYRSGLWASAANLLKTPEIWRANAGVGFETGRVSVEAFVTNIFNNDAYTTIATNNIGTNNGRYSGGPNNNVVVGLPELRTFGLKTKVKF